LPMLAGSAVGAIWGTYAKIHMHDAYKVQRRNIAIHITKETDVSSAMEDQFVKLLMLMLTELVVSSHGLKVFSCKPCVTSHAPSHVSNGWRIQCCMTPTKCRGRTFRFI
jgi:hypothetical protein